MTTNGLIVNRAGLKLVYGTKTKRAYRINQKLLLQRVLGCALLLAGAAAVVFEGDMTALVFLSIFYLPMLFGKKVMLF